MFQCGGVKNLGFADYRRVEQEFCCYVPGEVSRIENIMAREYKERSTRDLLSTKFSVEKTTEVEVEKLSDTSTTERFELQSEIQRQRNRENNVEVNAHFKVGGGVDAFNYEVGAGAGFASNNSQSTSNRNAQTKAREVVNRALERIVSRTQEKRTSTILKEFEENNRHGFDNREGDQHVTGVYRWVDKIYLNRIVNYDKHLIYEFMVPEPSRFFRMAMANEKDTHPGVTVLEKPLSPEELDLFGPRDLTPENYIDFQTAYKVQLNAPESFGPVHHPLDPSTPTEHKDSLLTDPYTNLPGEDNFQLVKCEVTYSFDFKDVKGNAKEVKFRVGIGNKIVSVTYPGDTNEARKSHPRTTETIEFDPPLSGSFSARVEYQKVLSYSVDLLLTYEILPIKLEEWQNETYALIISAYNNLLDTYNQSLAAANAARKEEEARETFNPAINRDIEQKELKRLCIELFTDPHGIDMGKDFIREDTSCGLDNPIPVIKKTRKFQRYTATAKFFEQAFEWGIMSYIFYPYYWAGKCSWKELLREQDKADPLFQSFLQSGMARVFVPVRRGFEKAVMFYERTGKIWKGGGLVMSRQDDLYLSIVDELRQPQGVVEDTWETRVPSSLTIIQKDSAGLNASGLPCCDDMDDVDTQIETSTNVLARETTSESEG